MDNEHAVDFQQVQPPKKMVGSPTIVHRHLYYGCEPLHRCDLEPLHQPQTLIKAKLTACEI